MLATLLRRYSDAEHHFRSTIDWAAKAEALPWLAHTRIEYARMLRARSDPGDPESGLEQADAAMELARGIGMAGVERDALSLQRDARGERSTVTP